MLNIKYGELYLSEYIELQRSYRKIINILTLLISVSGILGWKFFENYAWIAFVLVAVMQLFVLIKNEISRSDKDIENIAVLKMMYTKYFNKIEKLWTEYYTGKIKETRALDVFFELREKEWEKIEELDCKLNIKQLRRLKNKSERETNKYITKFHNYD